MAVCTLGVPAFGTSSVHERLARQPLTKSRSASSHVVLVPTGTYSACTGKGLFCNTGANHLIEYLCTCSTAPTPNWVNQGNGCYQHDTKVACQ